MSTERKALGVHGMNWLRKERRLAIYMRDGFACVYCGAGNELTLDHLIPYERGGSHDSENLATCCKSCNASRGMAPWKLFAKTAKTIAKIEMLRMRSVDGPGSLVQSAKVYLARTSGFVNAVAAARRAA